MTVTVAECDAALEPVVEELTEEVVEELSEVVVVELWLVLAGVDEIFVELGPPVGEYADDCSGRSMKAGTRSPLGHCCPWLHGFDLQHPQNVLLPLAHCAL